MLMFLYLSIYLVRNQMVDGHKIEFTLSARGILQLIIDDFPFCRKEKLQKKTYYACVQYKVLGFVTFDVFWNECVWFHFKYFPFSLNINVQYPQNSMFCNRCLARARLVNANNKVEIHNLNHNHPMILDRRGLGEAKRLRQALKNKRREALKNKKYFSSEDSD